MLTSKKLFIFNLVFIGIIIGFSISLVSFSCSTKIPSNDSVYADDDLPVATIKNLETIQNSFRAVSAEVLPVVVEVSVVEIKRQAVPDGGGSPSWPWNFGPSDPEESPREREFRNEGLGSGVIVRKEGRTFYVLTNDHVVGDADEIEISTYDGTVYKAEIVGIDDRRDLALVSFNGNGDDIPIARLGDSDDLYVGDWVLAIGNPFGFNSTVTAGIVSAKGRSGPTEISSYIQTDASINQGNSGGALVNIYGEVIGINTWIAAPNGGNIGLGFSIPINFAKKAIDDFIRLGEVEYGWLGVSIADPFSTFLEEMELSGVSGAFVYHVFLDSPADKGGLRPGDLIIELNGVSIKDANKLVRYVGDLPPNEEAVFVIIREGKELTLPVLIGRRKDRDSIAALNRKLWPGISVIPLTDELKDELDMPPGIAGVAVREVENKTKMHIGGLRLGDVITSINSVSIENVMDFYRALNDIQSKDYEISYFRDGNEQTVTIVK